MKSQVKYERILWEGVCIDMEAFFTCPVDSAEVASDFMHLLLEIWKQVGGAGCPIMTADGEENTVYLFTNDPCSITPMMDKLRECADNANRTLFSGRGN